MDKERLISSGQDMTVADYNLKKLKPRVFAPYIVPEDTPVLNYEQGEAYTMSSEMELYTAVLTASISDKFYESAATRSGRIAELVAACDPVFVAKLAVYAREVMNLRRVPLVLIVELSRIHHGDDLVSRTISHCVRRPDEITALMDIYQQRNDHGFSQHIYRRLSSQIKKGLKEAFNRFDEYQFAKYKNAGEGLSLRDALFLVHPSPDTTEQQAVFDRIASDTLAVPYTWETELSALGQRGLSESEFAEAKKSLWEELIVSGKVGYMALLRNLRNILLAGVDEEHLDIVCDRLSSEHEVLTSKQLPFRFLSAYLTLKEGFVDSQDEDILRRLTKVECSLEKAAQIACSNVKGFEEDMSVLLACDTSGSMFNKVGHKGSVAMYDIGILLSMMLKKHCCNVTSGMFADTWKVFDTGSQPILKATTEFRNHIGEVGYSTNGYTVIDWALQNDRQFDRIMMFTDCQLWDSVFGENSLKKSWDLYKEKYPDAKLFLFDLAGYGTSPLKLQGNDVCAISGWSEKVFDVMTAFEQGDSVLSVIKGIEV